MQQKLSRIKSSQLETILNYTLQFRLKKKVIIFVEKGGTITEAAHKFGIGIASIYRWLYRPKLEATKVKKSSNKIRLERIIKRCKKIESRSLADRAKKFGVNPTAIFYALKRMKITRKNNFVIEKEIERKKINGTNYI